VDVVDQGVFTRTWAVAPERFAWLLGAGTSAAAGLPTATQIRDDLLLRVYAERHSLVRQNLNANDPSVRAALEQYFDNRNGMVAFGSHDDYSCAFELALGDADARRQYLQRLLSGRRPSYGQRVFGALLTAGFVDVAITTNFDDLIEQAAAQSYLAVAASDDGPPARLLRVAALGSVDRARRVLDPQGHPILVKLHGDFWESSLKNLSSELLAQDEVLRQTVTDVSRVMGLAVIGYSGRDYSVMEMLESAAQADKGWPAGIWWFARDPTRVPTRVQQLLQSATSGGVPAHVVVLEHVDELMGALGLQAALPSRAREFIHSLQPATRLVEASPPPAGRKIFPLIRYNGLPITAAPVSALRAPVGSLDFNEFRDRQRSSQWRGIATMAGGEAWAWGDAGQFACIAGAKPELISIDLTSGEVEPGLHALFVQGLTRTIAGHLRARPLITRRENLILLQEFDDLRDSQRQTLERFKAAYEGPINGHLNTSHGLNVHGQPRAWSEAVSLHLEFRWGAPWLIFSPHTWVERRPREVAGIDPASEWRRERWVQRKKNEKWAQLIDTWAGAIAPERATATLPLPRAADPEAFGAFQVGPFSAFSWRAS
jgi:hypothetical protein